MRIRLIVLISICIMSWVNVALAEVADVPKAEGWDLVQTEHFGLHTDAQVRFVKKLGLELESLRAMLVLVTPDGVLHSTRPTTILVFKSSRSFDSYRPMGDDGKRRQNVGGYFLSRYDGNFMTIVADAVNDRGYEAVLHEYVHFVIDHTLPSVPAWFNEGNAQYYGTFASNGGSVDVGRINHGAMTELQRGWALPIEDLLGVDYQSPIYRGPVSIRHTFYAESWAVVHYFYHGNPERLGQLQDYLRLLNNGIDRHDAFTEAFGIDYATLQEEVRAYIRAKVLPLLRVSKDKLQYNDELQTRKVPSAEMKCRLGELVAHMGDPELDRAEQIFNSVVASNPKSSCGLRGLGYVAREREQREVAESYFGAQST